MPTVCGDGMSDVWPLSELEADYEAHKLVYSPLTITLTENGEGDFTAHVEAEAAVTGARFCMVAVHDDNVAAYGGATSHLLYHVVHMMTATAGDAFSLAAGASTDINHTFTVDPSWNYDKMGVACWVQAPGGTNTSPNPFRGASQLSFLAPRAGRVTLTVYDIAGHKVAEILNGPVSGGEHHESWDGTSGGVSCASGIYFASLVFEGEERARQKLVKLR
ncbi:MAG: T9SS type A sorting domain-containing protein [Candidatus Eisenbacteria bacterium]